MNRDEVRAGLERVIRDALEDDSIVIRDATTAKDVDGWNSISHINIVVGAEQRFRVKLTLRELSALNNVGELIDAIVAKSGSADAGA